MVTRAEEQQAIEAYVAKRGVTKCRIGQESAQEPLKKRIWRQNTRKRQRSGKQ